MRGYVASLDSSSLRAAGPGTNEKQQERFEGGNIISTEVHNNVFWCNSSSATLYRFFIYKNSLVAHGINKMSHHRLSFFISTLFARKMASNKKMKCLFNYTIPTLW
jgi:hypothetical protein